MTDDFKAVCIMLANCGVRSVFVTYNGSGDDGTVDESMVFMDEEHEDCSDMILNRESTVNLVMDVVYNILSQQDFDWVNNEGGFGVVKLFPLTETFKIEHNTRIEDTEYSEYEGKI